MLSLPTVSWTLTCESFRTTVSPWRIFAVTVSLTWQPAASQFTPLSPLLSKSSEP